MDKNKPSAKGVRTFIQAVGGFVFGLLATLWLDDGARALIIAYVQSNGPELLLLLGVNTSIFTGLISFGQNKVEDRQY